MKLHVVHGGESLLWSKSCSCHNPVFNYSKDSNMRMCQNCFAVVSVGEGEGSKVTNFVHLRVHTHLSFLKAICKTEDLIEKCKEYGMTALAKTEFGNMCGAPSFVKECVDAGIKPILGTDFQVEIDSNKFNITFIALNHDGYKSLVKMNTTAWCDRKTKASDPFIALSDIKPFGLIALVPFIDVSTTDAMLNRIKQTGVETWIEANYDNCDHVRDIEMLSSRTGTPVVATNNVLYTNKDDHPTYEVAMKIGHNEVNKTEHEYHFASPLDMSEIGFPTQWLENTNDIAKRVEDYKLINKGFIIPVFKDKNGIWGEEQVHGRLSMETWMGLAARGLSDKEEYVKRLEYELDMVHRKKFSSYFLIIKDIIDYIKSRGWLKPAGRGSSVGSLICYLLDITSMDPIKWGVPFERFINEGRKDLPDIDTDITQEGRPDVLKYIADTYGHDHVAQIATYQTMGLKSAIDNVGRALGISFVQNKDLRNKISEDVTSIEELPADIVSELNKVKGWVEHSKSLSGISRHLGEHAAGVSMSNESLDELIPLIPSSDGLRCVQYDMNDIGILGLLKLDMLGLRNIDIMQDAVKLIEVNHSISIDIFSIPFDDKPTYDLITTGDYVSLFQLDSPGYRRLCRQLKPDKFEHVMALNALFRPGPLESGVTDEYIKRRHGLEPAISWHPWLDDALSNTYQAILYQEEAMAMARILGGFSEVEADEFRKGIGKKNAEVVDACLIKLKEQALKREGLTPPPGFKGSLDAWLDEIIGKMKGYARYLWCSGHACIKKGSLVSTCDRGLVPIQDIKIGECVWSVREDTGDIFRNRVMNVINNGFRDTVRITSGDGRFIVCTSDHRFFTSKKNYKHASELIPGDSLKMFNKWIFSRQLNIFMASVTNSNKIPFFIVFSNFIRYYMMKAKSYFRFTKYAHTPISIKQFVSDIQGHFPTMSSFNSRSPISEEFIYTSGVDKNISFRKSFCYGKLAFKSHCSYFKNSLSNFWCNIVNTMSTKPTFFNKTRQWGGVSLKWEFIKYIFIPISFCVKIPYQLFVLIIFILFSITRNTHLFVSSRFMYHKLYVALKTSDSFCSSNIGTTSFTRSCGFIVGDQHDVGTSNTSNFKVFHNKSLEQNKITDVNVGYITPEINCEVFDLTMEQNPNYIANGFVIHNCGYAFVTYITAYLEAHYPLEYYASLLNSTTHPDKITSLIRGIMHKKVRIVPPHVNYSGEDYSIGYENGVGSIYMGLAAIKSMGVAAAEIVTERTKNGPFASFIEFCQRLPSVNKTARVSLVKCGAFTWDKSMCDRDKADNTDVIMKCVKKKNKSYDGTKVPSFEIAMQCYINGIDYTDIQKQENERSTLNSFITGHPAAIYQRLAPSLERNNAHVITPSMMKHCEIGETVLLVGMIDSIRQREIIKEGRNKGKPYLVLTISDNEETTITNIWSPECEEMKKFLVDGQIAMFECVTKNDKFRPGTMSISVRSAIMLSHGLPIQGIFLGASSDPQAVVKSIGGIVQEVHTVGERKYVAIRGQITVMPDILEGSISQFGDVKFMISMEAAGG